MHKPPIIHSLTRAELKDLELAKSLLENPGFTIRIANLLGSPVEKGFALLPSGWSNKVNQAAKTALLKALRLAVASLGSRRPRKSGISPQGAHRHFRRHRRRVWTCGAAR